MFSAGKCVSKARLDGKTAVVTGSNTGIGKVTAREFYRIGARVILACRDTEKAELAVDEIKKTVAAAENQPVGELVVRKLDLSSLLSVKKCAKELLQSEERINILVNNAGVMMCPKSKTEDGFELQFASSIHWDDLNLDHGYNPIKAYGQSKLANVLFSNELAARLKSKGVNVYSLHPGVVRTELGRHLNSSFFPGVRPIVRMFLYPFEKTPEQGAQTTIYCAIEESLAEETGGYYSDCKKVTPSAKARSVEDAKKLWDVSVNLVGLGDWDPFTAPDDVLPPLLQNI